MSRDTITISEDAKSSAAGAHAICLLTEWDEFKSYDYQAVYDSMVKPAFIFDGRNVLDHGALREIGFIVYALGKPLDPFLQHQYT
jgi:UDPglucose 6-dehydrogenase